jgi:hypothetical protein
MRAAWMLIPCFALAQHDQLSLKHGTYVLEHTECKEAPFAAMMSWDGVGFFGPHATRCKSRVLSRHGSQFTLSTSCAARGDGSPDPSGYVDTFLLTRLSNTRFVIRKQKQSEHTYRWCGAEGTDYPQEKQ